MKSGEFAKLCGTTKNTLIHYDQLGILKPSEVRENGYREYLTDDAARFFAVRALADAGLKLEQVKDILDDKDAATLSERVSEARAKILDRQAELERSRRALDEIERQLGDFAAITREARDGGPKCCGRPRIAHRPEQAHLVFETDCGIKPGENLGEIWKTALPAVRILESLGPESALAQYGFTARVKGSAPIYDDAYYVLPSRPKDNLQKGIVPAQGMRLETRPKGTYLECAYVGPWEKIPSAYEAIVDAADKLGLKLQEPFYETSAFRLFDDDGGTYACVISAMAID